MNFTLELRNDYIIRYYFAVLLKATCIIQGQQVNRITIRGKNKKRKKTAYILPDSMIDNGHERELDCNDIGSKANKKKFNE